MLPDASKTSPACTRARRLMINPINPNTRNAVLLGAGKIPFDVARSATHHHELTNGARDEILSRERRRVVRLAREQRVQVGRVAHADNRDGRRLGGSESAAEDGRRVAVGTGSIPHA